MRRRLFLGVAAAAALAGCGASGSGNGSSRLAFTNRLRIPPLARPVASTGGERRFALTMRAGRTEFLPGRPVPTWGVDGDYLGPTVRVSRGDRVAMAVTNRLDETSTLHWHGLRLPAAMDGGPHQMIGPGTTWRPSWTVDQPAITAWYHPHPHGATARHVYRGLAGLLIVDDASAAGRVLPHTYGVDDVPLIVQDKVIGRHGELVENSRPTFGLLGDDILVNGTYDPFLPVETSLVRLRLLNAANARVFHVGFADRRVFHVVGTDAGLLPAPAATARVRISPGERYEIVVPFAPGERVVLRSFGGDDGVDEGDFDLLRMVAADRLRQSSPLPSRLAGEPPVQAPDGAPTRRFTLNGGHAINGHEMDPRRVDEVVPAGATEIWQVVNRVYAHNFHIHGVEFAVLDVDGRPPPPHEQGPKDTVYVPPRSTVRLAVRYPGYTDPRVPYMYHCHILRHEDRGMMGQFVVVEPGTEGAVRRTLAGPEHRHA